MNPPPLHFSLNRNPARYGGHLDNPVEKLWWHLEGSALANRCCCSIGELLEVVKRYFVRLTPEKAFQLVA